MQNDYSIFSSKGSNQSVTLTRTFHPVGQGAFYSEVFKVNEEEGFVVIYDCGTESKGNYIKKEIAEFKKTLQRNTIDILFLSHFHNEHINGLDDLLKDITVKKTVIPMLPEEVILLTRVGNALEDRTSVKSRDSIISELFYGQGRSERFGEIVAIPPSDEDTYTQELFPRGVIPTKKPVPGFDPFWEYIPMNSITTADPRAIDFRNKILRIDGATDEHGNLDIEKLVWGKRCEVRKVYSKAMKGANDNLYTLVVESQPVYYDNADLARESRCLYTGDFDSVKNKGSFTRMMGLFPIKDIGVLQVPHHGSKENWQKDYLGKEARKYVVSVGSDNNYHHPDFWSMESIRKVPKNVLHIVTEEAASKWSEAHILQ